MTALLILASIIAGAVYRSYAHTSIIAGPDVTVYTVAFLVGLVAASAFAIRSKDKANIAAAVVLALNWAGAYAIYRLGDHTFLPCAILDLATAAWFILTGRTYWQWVVGFLFIASFGMGLAAYSQILPDGSVRPSFISVTYLDLTAIIGHIANASLGLSSGDGWGQRVRRVATARPWWLGRAAILPTLLRKSND